MPLIKNVDKSSNVRLGDLERAVLDIPGRVFVKPHNVVVDHVYRELGKMFSLDESLQTAGEQGPLDARRCDARKSSVREPQV